LKLDWELLEEKLNDALRHADSRIYTYMIIYLEWLCKDQLERRNVGLKARIFTYNNISHITINQGALAKYSQPEMLLWALWRELGAKVVMKLEQYPRDPTMFKYDGCRDYAPNKCVISHALQQRDSEGAHMAPEVSHYSTPAGVPLPQIPVVVNLPAIPIENTTEAVDAMEQIPITEAENTIDIKIDNLMKAFMGWAFQMIKANEPRYAGYQTARA